MCLWQTKKNISILFYLTNVLSTRFHEFFQNSVRESDGAEEPITGISFTKMCFTGPIADFDENIFRDTFAL